MTSLMTEPVWESKIFAGEWIAGGAADRIVVEPATGNQLSTVGMATPDDVAAAAAKAAAAQKGRPPRPRKTGQHGRTPSEQPFCAARVTCSSNTPTKSVSG